jgi:voltage-gated potassium channel Kch
MFNEVVLGSFHVFVTVIIHGIAMLLSTYWQREMLGVSHDLSIWSSFFRVFYVVIVMFIATVLESAWWAANYLYLGALETFEAAMYFSMVTYTTLGYGDITLGEEWRLLAAFQAANGVIIAGWSTALVFAVIQKLYGLRHRESPR